MASTLIAPPDRLEPSADPDPRRIHTCPECGHALRVSGLGRHRVYFELTDTLAEDPVMNRVCPGCGHGLPGKNQPFSEPISRAAKPRPNESPSA